MLQRFISGTKKAYAKNPKLCIVVGILITAVCLGLLAWVLWLAVGVRFFGMRSHQLARIRRTVREA